MLWMDKILQQLITLRIAMKHGRFHGIKKWNFATIYQLDQDFASIQIVVFVSNLSSGEHTKTTET